MNDQEMLEILQQSRTIAVVGLSNNPTRASLGVARFLIRQGYKVIPVNPGETEVLGQRAYPTVKDVPEDVDIVNVFRRSQFMPEVVEDALTKKPRCIWMQEGVIHRQAAERAEAAGVAVVMDRCILKELARLLPRMS